MRIKWIIVVLLLASAAVIVYALSDRAHMFLSNECIMCHVDEKNDPDNIRPFLTSACEDCHTNVKETQSHPTDVYATLPVPKDMPLTNGMITCLTCHYVHPKNGKQFVQKHYFLRRNVRGPLFCSICHEISDKGHIVVNEIHTGSFQVTNRQGTLDERSIGCIECHDTHFKDEMDFIGAGNWRHTSNMSHPIGTLYSEASRGKIESYRPESILRKEIKLFNGKVGCGTCHSIYSSNRAMLVINNNGSRLCKECHLK
jgi:predicted CXXCH cytochrome family protein